MKYAKSINSRQLSSFFLIVLLTITLTRIWSISLYYIFGSSPEVIERIVNDRWHHYQVGLALLLIAYLLRKFVTSELIYAIGLGIFLEEWPVFLNDLGFNTNRFYHTKVDFLLILGIVWLLFLWVSGKTRKYQH